MVGGSRIIAFGSAGEDSAQKDSDFAGEPEVAEYEALAGANELKGDVTAGETEWDDSRDDAFEHKRSFTRWLAPLFAIIAIAGWTGFYGWVHLPRSAAATSPAEWTSLIVNWTIPVLLVCVLWLLAMRNSVREASRFGNTARLLAHESDRLEQRLVTINQELSLAREFLASETRDLEAFGRIATDRLSKNAERLHELVRDNGSRIETIGTVGEAALDNMEKLRAQLPVIASSAKDVTNNIGNAGRTANVQLEELIKGFARINDFGKACERQVSDVRNLVEDTLDGFTKQCEQLDELASERFAELNQRGTEFRTELEKQEMVALASIRTRASALSEELEQSRVQLDANEEGCLESLRARLSAMRDESGTISRALRDSEDRALENWRTHLSGIEEERGALFSRIEESDAAAIANARNRLTAISEEARLIEGGIADRGEKLSQDLTARRTLTEEAEHQAIGRMKALLTSLDHEIDKRTSSHELRGAALIERTEAVVARLGEYDERMAQITANAGETEARIAASLQNITGKVAEAQTALSETESDISQLTDSSVRLLELIRASAEKSRTDIPQALVQSEKGLSATEARTREIRDALRQAGKNGEWLANQVEGTGTALKGILAEMNEMQFTLRNHAIGHEEALVALSKSLKSMEKQSERISEKARADLTDAIGKLDVAAREAVGAISEHGAVSVATLAEQIGTASAEAIDKALREKANEATGQLEQAASHAAGVSREASIQMRDQLSQVNELIGNLETRVAQARERAEEQIDNDFARRSALITEALNSNAIDIAKALSTEVSDTAWAGYLRGDRGIFTRRAVSLIDAGDAKAIQQVFEREPDFREHVSRYVHDFEAMLRQILSTRDGNALGVTLLSSDMGKLYVSLAQAIERLRS